MKSVSPTRISTHHIVKFFIFEYEAQMKTLFISYRCYNSSENRTLSSLGKLILSFVIPTAYYNFATKNMLTCDRIKSN